MVDVPVKQTGKVYVKRALMTDIQPIAQIVSRAGPLARIDLLSASGQTEGQCRSPDCLAAGRVGPRCQSGGLLFRPRGYPGRGKGSENALRHQILRDGGPKPGVIQGEGISPPLPVARAAVIRGPTGWDPPWGCHSGREDIAVARGHPPWTGEFNRASPGFRGCVAISWEQPVSKSRLDNSSGISPPVRSVHARDSITLGRGDVGWRKRRIPGRWSMSDLQGISPPVDECGIINVDCGLERRDSPKRHRCVPSDKDVGPHQIGVTKQEIICN